MRNAFIQTVKTIAQSMIDKAGFDKTRTGQIVGINTLTNTYSVRVDSHVYANVKTVNDMTYNIHDIVKVVIPVNQATQMYITSSVISDDSLGKKVGRAQALGEQNADDIDTLEGIVDDLEIQLDGKIDTWAQATDPSTAWETAEMREAHHSDLWLYTGLGDINLGYIVIKPQRTYKYNSVNQHWEDYSVSKNIFDLADGKSTVWYGTISDSFPDAVNNDYLVDTVNQTTYKRINGAWVAMIKVKEGLENLREDLEAQIDAKIETFAQNTDPSTAWTTTELKEQHNSDLWLYTGIEPIARGYAGLIANDGNLLDGSGNHLGAMATVIYPQGIYQYDAEDDIWVAYSSIDNNIFDLIDGKSTIYYGTPAQVTTAEENDYLVDKNSQITYRRQNGEWVPMIDVQSGLDDLRDELMVQIDGKIETWAQSANPADMWTTSTAKQEHNDDIWLYTGLTDIVLSYITIKPQRTYIYNANSERWQDYSVTKNIFDLADGKSTVWYTTTAECTGMALHDYLVDPNTGSTYEYTGTGEYNGWVKVTDYQTPISQIAERIDDLGNLWQLYITTTYSSSNVIYNGVLTKNSVDVTNQKYPDTNVYMYADDMEWRIKSIDGFIVLTYGSELTMPKNDINYGKVIQLRWVMRDFVNLFMTGKVSGSNVDGQIIVNSGGDKTLLGRAEVSGLLNAS